MVASLVARPKRPGNLAAAEDRADDEARDDGQVENEEVAKGVSPVRLDAGSLKPVLGLPPFVDVEDQEEGNRCCEYPLLAC